MELVQALPQRRISGVVREHVIRLCDRDVWVRSEAVQCIIAQIGSLEPNSEAVKLIHGVFIRQLWQEENSYVLEKIVFGLSLLATTAANHSTDCKNEHYGELTALEKQAGDQRCGLRGFTGLGSAASTGGYPCRKTEEIDLNKDRSSEMDMEGIDLNHNTEELERDDTDLQLPMLEDITSVLLKYLSTRHGQIADIVKLQVLRSLHHLAIGTSSLRWEAIAPHVNLQLGSMNPRLRLWAIRLLAESVKDSQVSAESASDGTDHGYGYQLIRALEEYTDDPHSGVREAALQAMVLISSKGWKLTRGCYERAVELFDDTFETVRVAAIELVGQWVTHLNSCMKDGCQTHQMDDPFIQVCKRLTDMSFRVRQVACQTLGNMKFVSEAVLLQTLNKRVVLSKDASGTPEAVHESDILKSESTSVQFHSSAAGAFVHGLEDEYYEVRAAAVEALAKLSVVSKKMSKGAVDLLVDMLNDHAANVRMQTMDAFLGLAHANQLVVQENHLHMFLSVLEDSNAGMRKAVHNLLSAIRLPSIPTYHTTVQTLLASLEQHPEDVTSVVRALARFGSAHGSQTESIADDLVHEMRTFLYGEVGLDEPRFAAILALLIGASKETATVLSSVPANLLMYARNYNHQLPEGLMLPEIHSVGCKAKQVTWMPGKDVLVTSHGIPSVLQAEEGIRTRQGDAKGASLRSKDNGSSCNSGEPKGDLRVPHMFDAVYCVVETATKSLSLLESKGLRESLRIIRVCRQDLQGIASRSYDGNEAVKFTMLYVDCISLVARFRAGLSVNGTSSLNGTSLQLLCQKLETRVRRMQHCFIGLQPRIGQFLQELDFLVLIWKQASLSVLAAPDTWTTLKEHMCSAVANADRRGQYGSEEASPFKRLQELVAETAADPVSYLSRLRNAGREFALSQWPRLAISGYGDVGTIREMQAEIRAPNSTCENPLQMVAGLPLGIQLDVVLRNMSTTPRTRLWVQLVLENSSPKFTFLDVGGNGIWDTTRDSTNLLPDVDLTRKQVTILVQVVDVPVAACVAKAYVVLEVVGDVSELREAVKGPRKDSILLPVSPWAEIHLTHKQYS